MATASRRSSAGTPLNRPVALAKKRRAAELKETADKVALETVLGITCYNGASLSASETCVAYPAGCVAVLFHPKGKGKQVHIHNRKPISCLSFSPNGSYLATGESGHEPCVRVWDCRSPTITQIVRLKDHLYGVQCVIFSPSAKHLVSVGYQHDRQILVWNWKTGTKLVHGKFANKVNCAAFSFDLTNKLGSYFVTVHNRRVQFWYYNAKDEKMNNTVTLKSRSAILGELQDNNFIALCCGEGALSSNTYALTKSGKLCLFNNKRTLERFTETKTSPAYSLTLGEQYLFCGCSNGVIRIFDPYTLDYIISMPHPHPLGIDVTSFDDIGQSESEEHMYPDTVAMAIQHNKLTAVYNDHSLYVWDLSNVRQIGGVHSFLFHSAGVWDVCTYPVLDEDSYRLLPDSCFITCSSDNTVRFWSLDHEKEGVWSHKNIYSKELVRVIYADPGDKTSLKDLCNTTGSMVTDKPRGVRCIQVHPDGQHIAMGDRSGNLAVYDLQFLDEIYKEIAHDSEILSISYSPTTSGYQLLATGSRDRMVHIFTTSDSSYQPIQSLNDHSAAVTAVKFVMNKDGRLQLLSSGADKSIIFHSMEESQGVDPIFNRSNNVVSKATIYDMDVDVLGKHIVIAGQDRMLRFYLVNGGKQRFLIKAPTGDSDGALLKVSLDPSGLYAVASCADKSVLIFDVFSGECVSKLTGHSELVTQVVFSKDCKYLYSVSGDSCIFVWRLSKKLTQAMHDRLAEMGRPLPPGVRQSLSPPPALRETYTKLKRTSTPRAPRPGIGQDVIDLREEDASTEGVDSSAPGFEFRMSMLPDWAQTESVDNPQQDVTEGDTPVCMGIPPEVTEIPPVDSEQAQDDRAVAPVEGRWAERAAGDGEIMFAVQDQDSDAELEDLSAEMTRIVFGKQSPMEVIDLTQDDDEEEATVSSPVTEYTDHVTEKESHVTEKEDDTEDEEMEMVFFNEIADIDPSLFSVTTPTKSSNQRTGEQEDSEEDYSPRDSPSDSPVLNREEVMAEDESSFLRANFESLEKTTDSIHPQFLSIPSPRLSISAKYFERSMQKSQPLQIPHGNEGSPELMEPAGIVISVQDINGHQSTSFKCDSLGAAQTSSPCKGDSLGAAQTSSPCKGDSLGAAQTSSPSLTDTAQARTSDKNIECSAAGGLKERDEDTQSGNSEKDGVSASNDMGTHTTQDEGEAGLVALTMDEDGQYEISLESHVDIEEPLTIGKMKRRLSFEMAVDETKKRLEELGYPVKYSRGISPPMFSPPKHEHSPPTILEQLPSTEPHPSPPLKEESVGSHKSVLVKPKRRAVELSPSVAESDELVSPPEIRTQVDDGYDRILEDDRESTLSRVRVLTENMDSSFQALVELHDQVLASASQDDSANSQDEVVGAIATYLVAHKGNLVSLVNRNRKLWRGRIKKRGNPMPQEFGVTVESGHTPLSAVLVSDQDTQCVDRKQNKDESSVSEGMESKEMKHLDDELSSPVCGEASGGGGREDEETGEGCELKRACDLTNELMTILNDLHERQNLHTSLQRQTLQERPL